MKKVHVEEERVRSRSQKSPPCCMRADLPPRAKNTRVLLLVSFQVENTKMRTHIPVTSRMNTSDDQVEKCMKVYGQSWMSQRFTSQSAVLTQSHKKPLTSKIPSQMSESELCSIASSPISKPSLKDALQISHKIKIEAIHIPN